MRHPDLSPGLYLVATPIGTAGDITLRALDILTRAGLIAAEDTRQTRHLLAIHGIAPGRRLISYHDHSPPARREEILAAIRAGQAVALVSDAGTPLVADPGYKLVQAVIGAGLAVTAAPGPSALLAALSLSGLPSDRFLFAGFLPPRATARRKAVQEVAALPVTLVFLEAPGRLAAALADMEQVFGDRPAAICRELTKRFEEVIRDRIPQLARRFAEHKPKGEIVLVVGGAENRTEAATLDAMILEWLPGLGVKETATKVSETAGVPRKLVYARILELKP